MVADHEPGIQAALSNHVADLVVVVAVVVFGVGVVTAVILVLLWLRPWPLLMSIARAVTVVDYIVISPPLDQ